MSCTLSLPCDATSAAVARRFVQAFAVERSLDRSAGAGCLIASELVTNAVTHGTAPVQLTVESHDGELTIEVADGDSCLDAVRIPDIDRARPGGLGLRVVSSLADRWGSRRCRFGKTVWATMRATDC